MSFDRRIRRQYLLLTFHSCSHLCQGVSRILPRRYTEDRRRATRDIHLIAHNESLIHLVLVEGTKQTQFG